MTRARVLEAEAGTAITRAGGGADNAYFILSGRLVAGRTTGEGQHHSQSSMGAGDVFGEIAALTREFATNLAAPMVRFAHHVNDRSTRVDPAG